MPRRPYYILAGYRRRRVTGFSWTKVTNQVIRYNPSDTDNPPVTRTSASFDGTNWLAATTANFRSADSSGSIFGWVYIPATTATQTIFSTADTATANYYLALSILGTGAFQIDQKNNDTADQVATTDTGYDDGAWHFVELRSSGTAWSIRVDKTDLTLDTPASGTNSGDWFADTTARDNVVLGALVTSSTSQNMIGRLDHFYITNTPLTDTEHDYLADNKLGFDDAEAYLGSGRIVFAPPLNNTSPGVWPDLSASELHLTEYGTAKGVTFASASSQYASSDATPTGAYPIAMGCSFKTTSSPDTSTQGLIWFGDKDSSDDFQALFLLGGTDVVARSISNSDAARDARSTGINPDDGAWHAIGGIFTSSSRTVVVEGDSVTESTAQAIGVTYDRLSIAMFRDASPNNPFNGTLDNCWLYQGGTALTVAQVNWLRTGGPSGGPATYRDVQTSNHPDNPGISNLRAWYKLNESSGTTLVNVHNPGTYDLTTQNSPTLGATGHVIDYPGWADGTVEADTEVEDRALRFNGTNQYASRAVTGFRSTDTTGSWSFWFQESKIGTANIALIGSSDGGTGNNTVEIYLTTTSKLQLLLRTGGANLSGIISDATFVNNTLHHVVVVSNGTDYDLYVNGSPSTFAVNVADDGKWYAAVGSRTNLTFASRVRSSAQDYMTGVIDEPMYFNSALNTDDASELYNGGAGVLAADLISGAVSLTSGKKPIHAWPLNSRSAAGATADIGTTGGLTLTLNNSPTDAAGIPAGRVIGGSVYKLPDLSGNSRNALQTDITKRRWLSSESVGTVLSGDTVSKYLQTASFTAVSQPTTVVLVTKVTAPTTAQSMFDGIAAANEHGVRTKVTTGVIQIDGGTEVDGTATVDAATWTIWTIIFNGASSKIYKNGGTPQTVNAGSEGITGATIGALYDGTLAMGGSHGDIMVKEGAISVANHNAMGRYLATIYGITWNTVSA